MVPEVERGVLGGFRWVSGDYRSLMHLGTKRVSIGWWRDRMVRIRWSGASQRVFDVTDSSRHLAGPTEVQSGAFLAGNQVSGWVFGFETACCVERKNLSRRLGHRPLEDAGEMVSNDPS